MNNLIVLLITLLLSVNLYSADYTNSKMPANSKAKLQFSANYIKYGEQFLSSRKIEYPYFVKEGNLYIDLLIQINSKSAVGELIALGCKISVEAGDIIAVTAPVEKINAILALESVKAMETAELYSLGLNKSKDAINAREVKVDNDLTPNNIIGGEGVIVGVFDTGIDIAHPDFKNESGTRILKLWDMTDKSSGKAPEGFDFGREYSKNEIDVSPSSVLEKDVAGHGTHVAGTAAGNGSANLDYRGIAYNSDLIIVKGFREDSKPTFADADIIAGCVYIFSEAKKFGRPVVINLSLGSPLGPHDGKGLLAMALSALVGKGQLIVASAGNEGGLPIHAGGEVENGELIELPIYPLNLCEMFENFCPDIPDFYMTAGDIWYTASSIDSLILGAYIMGDNGLELYQQKIIDLNTPLENEMFTDDMGNPLCFITFFNTDELSTNGSGNCRIQIHNGGMLSVPVGDFLWSIGLKIKKSGNVDMWAGIPIPDGLPFMPQIGSDFFYGNNFMTFGTPGDADSIISVGSFVSKNSWVDKNGNSQFVDAVIGSKSAFSALGPRRDGRFSPIISAPGQIIFASKSKDSQHQAQTTLEGDYYVGLSGTSMSAPHVTGAVALMLQVNPNLQFSDVAGILEKSSVKDNFTGNVPNNEFGLGKINVQAAVNYMLTGTDVKYVLVNDVKVYPNPAADFVNLEISESIENPVINLYSTAGEKVNGNVDYQFISSGEKSSILLNVSGLPAGVYNADCKYGNKISKFRFVVIKQ